tara:strand:+ start:92 stop:277 length:186 start_codon:yes stop_codon:yes gene_type:complete
MISIINYILDNGEALLNAATALVAACSAIAALTPTPSDDGIVRKLYKVIDFLALNIGRAKQ